MSSSPDWYLGQADLLYGRADECLRLARELADAPLVSLLDYAGEDTWQCPAADDFRQCILLAQRRVLDAVESLESSALGLADEADQMARTAAALAAEEREAARQRSIERQTS